MSEKTSPDYYRILQVHPEAELDVIDAAYRRLMRKYHPDALSPEERDNVETQKKVRGINEAYSVLSDRGARAAYDSTYRPSQPQKRAPVPQPSQQNSSEKRTVAARCSKTGQEFNVQLARKKDSKETWRVVGFDFVEPAQSQGGSTIVPANSARALINRLLRVQPQRPRRSGFGSPSDEELEGLFDDSHRLDFGDINWAGRACPVCSGEAQPPEGVPFKWCICGSCSRISCMGGWSWVSGSVSIKCAWCGRVIRLAKVVASGVKTNYMVQEDEPPASRPLLHARPSLSDGKKKSLPK